MLIGVAYYVAGWYFVVGRCGVGVAYGVVVGMFAGGTAAVPESAQSW